MPIEWKLSPERDELDPQDGCGPILYWWEDMRPGEVREEMQEAYERGYKRGLREMEQMYSVWDDEDHY